MSAGWSRIILLGCALIAAPHVGRAHGPEGCIAGCAIVAGEAAIIGLSQLAYRDGGAGKLAAVDGVSGFLATGVTFALSLDGTEGALRTTGTSLLKSIVVSAPLWGLAVMNQHFSESGTRPDTVFTSNLVGLNLAAGYWLLVARLWPKGKVERRSAGWGPA